MNVSAAKQTEYHFAPLARFAARFRSTAPLTLYGTDAAELRGIDPQRLKSEIKSIFNKLNCVELVEICHCFDNSYRVMEQALLQCIGQSPVNMFTRLYGKSFI